MTGPIVDLMARKPGVYFCANWCEDGRTSIRGNFCPECSWDEGFHMLDSGITPNSGWNEWFDMFHQEVFDKVGLRLV